MEESFVFCGNCGQENRAGNRFCGMCGTPIPQRPLTATGAQSTLSFTRLPIEKRAASAQRLNSDSRVSPETAGRVNSQPPKGGPIRTINERPLADEAFPSHIFATEPLPGEQETMEPAQTLAPEPSLERFIQQFKYEPPTESELTMGGTPIPPTEHFRPIIVPQPSDTINPGSTPIDRGPIVAQESTPIAPEPVRSGIGLVDSVDEPAERPRFLDLGEPAGERLGSGTSTIVGPSFLGLSDAPDFGVESEHAGSHWRMWLALLVVAVFGVLGFLEWRAQTHQTAGPVEIVRMQIQRLKHGSVPDASNSQTPPLQSTDGKAAAPEMQVAPQSKPQDTTAGSGSGNNGTSTNAPPAAPTPASSPTQPASASDAAAPQNDAPIGNQPPAGEKSDKPAAQHQTAAKSTDERPAATPNSTTTKTNTANDNLNKPKSSASDRDQEVVTRKSAPGQEEMAKADQASDSAAAAAWLWKAVAKGNPEAPVRLSEMYVKGDGVPKSCDQAMVLLKSAASKQNARARNRLGSMYATGSCVARDRVQAYKWLSFALVADPSSEWAQQNRDLLWRQMSADERSAAAKYQ